MDSFQRKIDMKPNENFKLGVNDIAIIESALNERILKLHKLSDSSEAKEIHDLLGRIHNQKVWYRPKKEVYISG